MIASTFSGVHDFFHSSTWYVIRNLGIFFVIVFWVASVYWVFKDARRRISDKLIVGVVTAIGVVSNPTAHNLKEDAKDAAKDSGMKKTNAEHGHLTITDVKMVSESCQ